MLIRLISDDWSAAAAYQNESPSYPIAREAIGGLDAYGSLTDEIGDALLLQAERTDDRSLGVVALNTAARCCGPEIREKIWALSSLNQARWVRVDAINALIFAAVVESEILDAINAKLILRLPPPLAASACVLLAVHGQVDAAVKVMERIAHSTKQRSLLDTDHPARRLLDLTDGEKLPASALGDLGHIHIRKVVQEWLDEKIAKD